VRKLHLAQRVRAERGRRELRVELHFHAVRLHDDVPEAHPRRTWHARADSGQQDLAEPPADRGHADQPPATRRELAEHRVCDAQRMTERRRRQTNGTRATHDEARVPAARDPQEIERERKTATSDADTDPERPSPHDLPLHAWQGLTQTRGDEASEGFETERQREVLEIPTTVTEARHAARQVDGEAQVRERERKPGHFEWADEDGLVQLETEHPSRDGEPERYMLLVGWR
jgi:hypothetical protein